MLWASLLITIGMPCRLAAAQATSSRSSRAGLALSSSSLPCRAAAANDLIQIDGVWLAAVDQPAGRMGDDRDMRIFQRAENPLGDLLARLLLAVVDAGDDPIGFGQHVVGQVHAALFEDVALDAFEDGEVVELAVEHVDFLPLLAKPLGVQARWPC